MNTGYHDPSSRAFRSVSRSGYEAALAHAALFALLSLALIGALPGRASCQFLAQQKISATQGGNVGALGDSVQFGSSVAYVGDIDGDGIGDLVAGIPWDFDGGSYKGAVKVLFMNADGTVRANQKISTTAGNFAGVLDFNDHFGYSVAGLGDLDNDGINDIAVGAIGDDDGGSQDRGAVWILFLNANGTVKAYQKISATQGNFTGTLIMYSYFGSGLAPLDDFDGDGVEDLLVGSMTNSDGGAALNGSCWILLLNANGTVKSHQKISATQGGFTGVLHAGDEFGKSMAAIGDLDHNGVKDIVVGAWYDDDGETGEHYRGAVWILFLNANGTVKAHQKISATEGGFTGLLEESALFGTSLAACGDLDGDGVEDIVVGSEGDHEIDYAHGAVWILYLNSNGTVKASQKINDVAGGFTGTLGNWYYFGSGVAACDNALNKGLVTLIVGTRGDPDGGTWGPVGSLWLLQYLPRDTDGDGVPDKDDRCRTESSSYFDQNRDGCTDIQAGGRHVEYWPYGDALTFTINEIGAPYITDGSAITAIMDGIQEWYNIPGGFNLASPTFVTSSGQDTARALDFTNTVTFTDTEYDFGPAVLAVGITTSFTERTYVNGRYYLPGQIVDADLIFNPNKKFTTSTVGGAGTDIRSVATHEAGHLFGLSHSAVRASTMFFVLQRGTEARSLEKDDISAFRHAYLDTMAVAEPLSQLNILSGIVRDGLTNAPVPGALVFALQAGPSFKYDTVACDITLPDGRYTFALPRGTYYVAIHPIDGSSSVGYLQPPYVNWMVDSTAATSFVPEFYDGAESAHDNPLDTLGIGANWGGTGPSFDIITNIDEEPPAVTSISPATGAMNVSIDAPVLIRFSEEIDPATLQGSFSLVDPLSRVVGGYAAIVRDDSMVAFTHSQPLAYATTYTLTLGTALSDRHGNTLAAPFVSSFITEAAPALSLTSLVPDRGTAGSIVTINGSGFNAESVPDNVVRFQGPSGTVEASLTSVSPTQIIATVPSDAVSGEVTVQVGAGPVSNGLTYTLLSSTEIARGAETDARNLGDLPRALTVLPDGSYAFLATAVGALAVNLTSAGLLDITPIATGGGLDELDATPDGKRVYAVSRTRRTFHVIDNDPASATHFQQLGAVQLSGEPLGIVVDPAAGRAYLSTMDGMIQVWDVKQGSPTFMSPIGLIASPDRNLRGKMAIDPAGRRLLALSGQGRLLVFNLGSNALEAAIPVGSDPRDVVVDPTGQRAYVTDAVGFVTVVSLASLVRVTDIETGGSLRGCALTPAGRYLYAANRELNVLDVIDLDEHAATYRSVVATIKTGINPVDVEISPDGLYAYTIIEAEKKLTVTSIGVGPVIMSMSRRAAPTGAKIVFAGTGFEWGSESDRAVFTGAGGTTVWDHVDRSTPTTGVFTVHPGAVSGPVTIALDKNSRWQTSNQMHLDILGSTASLGDLRVAERKRPGVPENLESALAVSPAGDLALIGTQSGKLLFWDTDAQSPAYGTVVRSVTADSRAVEDVVFTPDGKRAYVSVPTSLVVRIVNTDRTSVDYGSVIGAVGTIPDLDTFVRPREMAMGPDGELLLIHDDSRNEIYFVDTKSGSATEQKAVRTVPASQVNEIAFFPDGRFAYAASRNANALLVIDTDVLSPTFGSVVDTLNLAADGVGHYPVSLSIAPDGSRCLVLARRATDGAAAIISIDSADPTDPPAPVFDHIGSPMELSYVGERIRISPRGDRAIANEPTTGLWDIDLISSSRTLLYDGLSESGEMDYDFSIDGTRIYAISSTQDSLIIYELSKPDSMLIVSGNGQTCPVDRPLRLPLRVGVMTETLEPASGVSVTFRIVSGGGVFAGGAARQSVITDENGIAEVAWTLGAALGAQTVEAAAGGLAGSPRIFSAEATGDPNALPLAIVRLLPAQNSSDVGVTTSILAAFSRPVTHDTALIDSTFLLRKAGDPAAVATVHGFTDNDRTLSLTPVSPLETGTTYTVYVTDGLLDAGGNPIASGASVSFTTESVAPPLVLQSLSPPSALRGMTVTLAGSGFDKLPGHTVVRFNQIPSIPAEVGTNYLRVMVPPTAESGPVTVEVNGSPSNALPFTILMPTVSPADSVIATVGTAYATKSAAITPDGSRLYAVSPQSAKVIPIKVAYFLSEPAIPVGTHPISIDIDPEGAYAYVANFKSGSVSIVDLKAAASSFSRVVGTSIVGGNPIDVAVSPDGNRIYVANAGTNDLDIIDGDERSATHHQVIASVGTGSSVKSVAITPDGARIYIGTTAGYVAINAADYSVVASVSTGSSTKSVAITPDGALLVLLTTESRLMLFNIVPGGRCENQVVATISMGSSTKSVAVTPDGALLYLIQDESDEIIVLSLETYGSVGAIDPNVPFPPGSVVITPVDTVYAGEDPEFITFDPSGSGLAFVTNAGPQTITVLDVAAPPLLSLRAPCDSIIPPLPDNPVHVLRGFTIRNNADFDLSFRYNVRGSGPALLGDNGNPASLDGTTPLIAPGSSYEPPPALLLIPLLNQRAREIVTYHVRAVQEPSIADSCRTVVTIEPLPEIGILISGFEAYPGDEGVRLTWSILSDEGVRGYNIYRASRPDERGMPVNGDALLAAGNKDFLDRSVRGQTTYRYMLGVVLADGSEITSAEKLVTTRAFPFALRQNYPNPFNPKTTIAFSIPEQTRVNLSVYSVDGRLVATLVDTRLPEGFHEVTWDGRNARGTRVSSGVYLYRLTAEKKVLTRKFILLR